MRALAHPMSSSDNSSPDMVMNVSDEEEDEDNRPLVHAEYLFFRDEEDPPGVTYACTNDMDGIEYIVYGIRRLVSILYEQPDTNKHLYTVGRVHNRSNFVTLVQITGKDLEWDERRQSAALHPAMERLIWLLRAPLQ